MPTLAAVSYETNWQRMIDVLFVAVFRPLHAH
jgi:hypothetical protein